MSPPIKPIAQAKGSRVPSLCVFIDTETLSGKGKHAGETIETFRLACAIKIQRIKNKWRRRECNRFTNGRDLWDWIHGLESYRCPVWIFAHNLGYDLAVSGFFDYILSGRWSARDVWPNASLDRECPTGDAKPWRGAVVLSDPPTYLVLRSVKGSIKLVDTCNYFYGPLATMGDSIRWPQLDSPARSDPDSLWFDRCMRDVEILERSVCGWIDQWSGLECGSWRSTAAGLGYCAWRNTLKDIKVVPNQEEHQLRIARDAYYGGQCEVFYCGSVWPALDSPSSDRLRPPADVKCPLYGPVYHLDVHALYPSVMRDRLYPCKFLGMEKRPTIESLTERSKYHLPIARVFIRSEHDTYPVRRSERYLHAVGAFTTTLCGDELMAAIRRGHVERVAEIAWYQPADLFSDFVDRWMSIRRSARDRGDRASEMFAKLILNSVSGKFAQWKSSWVECPDIAAVRPFGEWEVWHAQERKMTRYRAFAGVVQRHEGLRESRQSFPAISAHITANGRERMRFLRGLCPPGSILYMDTDSIICLKPAYDALCDHGEVMTRTIGKLDVKAIWDWIEIKGFKFYGSPDGIVCPGLKKDARIEGPGKWSQDRFERLASILSHYQGPQVTVNDLYISPQGTTMNRTIGHNGYTVPPRLVGEAPPF